LNLAGFAAEKQRNHAARSHNVNFVGNLAAVIPADNRAEMMGFLGAGNNPMVGMTVSVAVAVEESLK